MKNSKAVLLFGLFLFASTAQSYAQVELPEVRISAVRYKYLIAVNNKDAAQPVKLLERQAAVYDVTKAEFYEDDYDNYFVSFYIPEGRILAAYDKNGKLLRTAEKYKSVALPKTITDAVGQRFPNWRIAKDVYLVNYMEDKGANKVYKLLLENGDKRMKVKVNERGEFI